MPAAMRVDGRRARCGGRRAREGCTDEFCGPPPPPVWTELFPCDSDPEGSIFYAVGDLTALGPVVKGENADGEANAACYEVGDTVDALPSGAIVRDVDSAGYEDCEVCAIPDWATWLCCSFPTPEPWMRLPYADADGVVQAVASVTWSYVYVKASDPWNYGGTSVGSPGSCTPSVSAGVPGILVNFGGYTTLSATPPTANPAVTSQQTQGTFKPGGRAAVLNVQGNLPVQVYAAVTSLGPWATAFTTDASIVVESVAVNASPSGRAMGVEATAKQYISGVLWGEIFISAVGTTTGVGPCPGSGGALMAAIRAQDPGLAAALERQRRASGCRGCGDADGAALL